MLADAFQRIVETPRLAAAAILWAVLLVAWVDYATGIEVRVYPLYFLPLMAAAWRFGLRGAMTTSLLASFGWVLAMYLGGREYSRDWIWVVNTLSQGVAFFTVSALFARLQSALQRERDLGRIDPLTGLNNLRAFREQATDRLAVCRRQQHPATLAYLDLDNFKQVNDRFGHAAGDRVLQQMAQSMREGFRGTDLLARVGGDEFIVLLPDTTAEQAYAALDKLRARLAALPDFVEGGVTASIGAVGFARVELPLEAMVKAADRLMYQVKTGSKNRVVTESQSPA